MSASGEPGDRLAQRTKPSPDSGAMAARAADAVREPRPPSSAMITARKTKRLPSLMRRPLSVLLFPCGPIPAADGRHHHLPSLPRTALKLADYRACRTVRCKIARHGCGRPAAAAGIAHTVPRRRGCAEQQSTRPGPYQPKSSVATQPKYQPHSVRHGPQRRGTGGGRDGPRGTASRGQPGEHDDVAEVAADGLVEEAAAGNKAQVGGGGGAVYRGRRELVLGVGPDAGDGEDRQRPVGAFDVDALAGAHGPQPEEDARPVAGVDVARDDRGPGRAGPRAAGVPAGPRGRARDPERAVC